MRKGWEYKKLGEVGQIVTGSTPSTKDESNYSPREYCFVKPSDLPSQGIADIEETEYFVSQVGLSKSRVLPAGSVLVSCIGSIGKIGILTKEACSNQQINAIIPQDETDSRFIAYSLYAQRFVLESIANAPVVPIINKTDFSKIRIGIPPKSTQLAIVSELDKINELIRLKKEQLKDFDNLAQSLFYEMFGDPVENEKGWNKMKWKDVLTIINGKNQSAVVDENGDYPIYGSGGIIGYANNWLCPEKCTIIGRKGNINKPIFVESKFWNVDTAFGLKPNIEILSPRFLFYFCLNYNFERHNKAVTIPSLTKADLLKIDIPLPPLSLQRLFAQRIEQIEREKSEVQKSIQDLETLLASRMQYWFE